MKKCDLIAGTRVCYTGVTPECEGEIIARWATTKGLSYDIKLDDGRYIKGTLLKFAGKK
jgi:hypothetical protein